MIALWLNWWQHYLQSCEACLHPVKPSSHSLAHNNALQPESMKSTNTPTHTFNTDHLGHDLRTPLNAIIGFTQIMELGLMGDITNPYYKEYLHHIQQSGYELLDKIDVLLEQTHANQLAEGASPSDSSAHIARPALKTLVGQDG